MLKIIISLDILMAILGIANEEVQDSALDSINSLLSAGLKTDGYIDEIREVVNNKDSSNEIVNVLVKSLQKKIG